MVYTPGVEPDATTKRQGLAAVQRVGNRVASNLQDNGVTAEEFDAAIDEALEHVRRRDG